MQIGEVASFQNGYAFKSKDFVQDGKYKIIKIKELKDGKVRFFNDSASVNIDDERIIEKYIVEKEDVLFALTGDPVNKNNPLSWVGRVSVYEDDQLAVLNQRVCKLVPKEGLNAKYIYYYFRIFNNFYALASIAKGSASQANISTKDIEAMEIALPSLNIQNKIVSVLDSIEEKINQNNKINKNLEQQAKALYKDWFFDFSPFSTEGNFPDGWRLGTVGDIIQLHDSKRVPLSGSERDKMEKIYPYYGAASLMDYVDNYLFDGIYLLLGEDGTVVDSLGFPILQYVYGQFWVNNHAHIITGKEGFSVEELYLFFSLTNIKSIVTGAVQQKVSQQNLKKVQAIIPSKEALSAFDDLIQPIFAQIRNLRDENTHLADLRDTLLPRKRLWNDIVEMQRKGKAGHFVGSIVNIAEQAMPTGVQKYMIIDGQQRMTTLTLLLLALRDYAIENPSDTTINARRIDNMLLKNEYESGDERYKLLLTETDRDILIRLPTRI